ncbi:hypothetical protein N7510_011809 [Penicillium lagena]|uniref:uncharacterized protein n=1 Tax=Penicillium lagena TaxID=94218 RepID=UPI0025417781|nr:uncharacterized protein N7510_011809 [Penicillium lagena]KAJ5602275.1 hypothetical protein N7510_011809 [Penicillium lagena]
MADSEVVYTKPEAIEAESVHWAAPGLKTDPHGFSLHPQPSNDPHDPLNWSPGLKLWILFQVSMLSMLSPFTQAIIVGNPVPTLLVDIVPDMRSQNSAYGEVSEAFHISIQEASYALTVAIITSGVFPLIWSPLSNIYGRRPVFVFVSILGIVGHAASGAAKSWAGILASRAIMGIGTSAGSGIGLAVVADMYFMHERGSLQNGAHLAGVIGGFVSNAWGWRWCFWLPTIIWAVNWVVNVFCLPETLYYRQHNAIITADRGEETKSDPWLRLFTFNSSSVGRRRLVMGDFLHVVRMLRYPSVLFPTIYYSVSFGIGTVMFAVTGAAVFGSIYHFDTAQIGMIIGLPTLIGSIIGEVCAGPVSDWALYIKTKRDRGISTPEARLQATWPGFLLMPIGVIIEGVCLQFHTHWMGPAMGMAIALFGLQIVSTNIFAYMMDCYKPQSAELSTILNFGRQVFSFTLGFYMLPFAHATNYGIAWAVVSLANMSLFAGVVALMWKGKEWREKLGPPEFDECI